MGLELVSKEDIDINVSRRAEAKVTTPAYTGIDHRVFARRINLDRREMVRFEDKPDRRSGKERRVANQLWDGRDL